MMDDSKRTQKVDGLSVDYSGLSEHIRDGFFRYVEQRIPTGSGLQRLLENRGAIETWGGLDVDCQRDFDAIIKWIYNKAPGECWGSPEAVREWLRGRK